MPAVGSGCFVRQLRENGGSGSADISVRCRHILIRGVGIRCRASSSATRRSNGASQGGGPRRWARRARRASAPARAGCAGARRPAASGTRSAARADGRACRDVARGWRGPSQRITARSSTLASSRTLPGQGYAVSCRIASTPICRAGLPMRRANSSTKWRASGGTSAWRSRSGGTWIGKMFSR